jgi:hypothetical protein
VTVRWQYSCCGKSAFTESGRRDILHTALQNGGTIGKENAFALARELYFDAKGFLRQVFVPELAVLRGVHHPEQQYTVGAGRTLPLVPAGDALEIKARRVNVCRPGCSWGLIVFGSADLTEGTRIGFNQHHFFIDRRAGGDPAVLTERDVRAGPLPLSTSEQSVHIYLDRSVISVIASNETAITVWTHPAVGATHLGLFAEGAAADVSLEVWEMGSILQ